MNISTFFFDLGNTLLHNHHLNDDSIRTACRRMSERFSSLGYNVDPQELGERHFHALKQYYGGRDIDYIEQSADLILQYTLTQMGFPILPPKDISQALSAFYASTQENWDLTPHAVETLESLRAQQKKIGLITNASYAEDIRQLLKKHQLTHYFDAIVISAEVGYRKPRQEIFDIALSQTDSQPQGSVMIGDTYGADIFGAKQKGMTAIWFKRYVATKVQEIPSCQPDAIITDLAELPTVIQNLETA